MGDVYVYYLAIARWLIAGFSILLGFLWITYFKKTKTIPSLLAELTTVDGVSIPITAKENIIGRTKRSDILIPLEGVCKKHAMLYAKGGRWFLAPIEGKIAINLQNLTQPAPLEYGDKITIARQKLTFKNKSSEKELKSKGGAVWLMVSLSIIQLLVLIEIMLKFGAELPTLCIAAFLALLIGEWVYFAVGYFIKHFKMLVEIPVLYMSTFGLAVLSTVAQESVFKHIVCYLFGMVGYVALVWVLKFPELCQKIQRIVMVLSVALLYYTAFFGTITGGARNWLVIGGFSFQPSELCKPVFVFCGGATLYNIVKNPKMKIEFIIYSILSMGALAIMYDFGAVAIFFVGMLMVLTLRLMKPIYVFGITGIAFLGTVALTIFFPYIARRFGVWLHAWEYADSTGFQQTRTMIAAASGGLLGVGGGNGYLSGVSASDTDLVFGIVSEEWGGIAAIGIVCSIVAIALYAIRLAKNADSAFYSVCALCAIVMIIFQSALNIFGSLDILPLTGVTLIFVSRGGTSIISAILMMAFLKAPELHKRHISEWRYDDEVD